jgi:hypothetical protein
MPDNLTGPTSGDLTSQMEWGDGTSVRGTSKFPGANLIGLPQEYKLIIRSLSFSARLWCDAVDCARSVGHAVDDRRRKLRNGTDVRSLAMRPTCLGLQVSSQLMALSSPDLTAKAAGETRGSKAASRDPLCQGDQVWYTHIRKSSDKCPQEVARFPRFWAEQDRNLSLRPLSCGEHSTAASGAIISIALHFKRHPPPDRCIS